jgi:hypothetical protein
VPARAEWTRAPLRSLSAVFGGPTLPGGEAMEPDPIERAAAQLIATGLAMPGTLLGCSDVDVREVESAAGGPLPWTYRQFLVRMGRSTGRFMQGTDVLFPAILRLRRGAEALLRECGQPFTLRAEDFVFSSHQGYQFLFFDRTAGDDPPVQYFLEGDPGPSEVFARFTSWLHQSISDELR